MTYKNYSDIDFINDEFFVRWVRNPDKETDHFWKSWLANNPEKRQEVEVARRFLEQIQAKNNYVFPEAEFIQLHENILRYNREQRYSDLDRKHIVNSIYSRAVAAVIIMLIVAVGLFFFFDPSAGEEPGRVAFVTKTTVKGTRTTFRLPDGTTVKLNADSEVRYPETFGDQREVFLSGEAFFEVVKDVNRPFLVHSKELTTRVLGTSFNIRAYQQEKSIKVALLEGKVQVQSEGQTTAPVNLHPDDMVIYEAQEKIFVLEKFEYLEEFGWKDGILYFSDKTLAEVFKALEHWYGVQIETEDESLLNDLYEGEFNNETLENILTSIGYASGFEFEIHNAKVKIY
jgi:ferric-dicitrate binding protein FerR (iron transport regulator)